MRANVILGLVLASLLLCPASVRADGDIVWPTYAQASYPSDTSLTCEQLRGTIEHVTSDIALLTKARDRTGDIVRSGFDKDSSVGRLGDRRFTLATPSGGQEFYAKAHEQIIASRGVAFARLNYLNGLVPACKDAPAATKPAP